MLVFVLTRHLTIYVIGSALNYHFCSNLFTNN